MMGAEWVIIDPQDQPFSVSQLILPKLNPASWQTSTPLNDHLSHNKEQNRIIIANAPCLPPSLSGSNNEGCCDQEHKYLQHIAKCFLECLSIYTKPWDTTPEMVVLMSHNNSSSVDMCIQHYTHVQHSIMWTLRYGSKNEHVHSPVLKYVCQCRQKHSLRWHYWQREVGKVEHNREKIWNVGQNQVFQVLGDKNMSKTTAKQKKWDRAIYQIYHLNVYQDMIAHVTVTNRGTWKNLHYNATLICVTCIIGNVSQNTLENLIYKGRTVYGMNYIKQ